MRERPFGDVTMRREGMRGQVGDESTHLLTLPLVRTGMESARLMAATWSRCAAPSRRCVGDPR